MLFNSTPNDDINGVRRKKGRKVSDGKKGKRGENHRWSDKGENPKCVEAPLRDRHEGSG